MQRGKRGNRVAVGSAVECRLTESGREIAQFAPDLVAVLLAEAGEPSIVAILKIDDDRDPVPGDRMGMTVVVERSVEVRGRLLGQAVERVLAPGKGFRRCADACRRLTEGAVVVGEVGVATEQDATVALAQRQGAVARGDEREAVLPGHVLPPRLQERSMRKRSDAIRNRCMLEWLVGPLGKDLGVAHDAVIAPTGRPPPKITGSDPSAGPSRMAFDTIPSRSAGVTAAVATAVEMSTSWVDSPKPGRTMVSCTPATAP